MVAFKLLNSVAFAETRNLKFLFFSVSKICPDGGFNDFVNLGNLCDFMQSIEICDYKKKLCLTF